MNASLKKFLVIVIVNYIISFLDDEREYVSILKKSPEVGDVFNLTKSHSTKWDEIAIALEVDESTRTSVQHDIQLGDNGKLDQILQKWNEAVSSDVTWEKILQVLESMELSETASEVKQFLKKPSIIKKYSKARDFDSS